jgi:glycosyltransferase involved in cell wall biosynthesis
VNKQGIKRIAIVANTTWNIFNFRQNIIKKLIDQGHEVFVLAPIDEYIEYKEHFPAVEHINIKQLIRDGKNPFSDLYLLSELRTIYKEINPHLIIHYTHKANIFGTLAAASKGYKSISIITGLGYAFIHKGWINTITKILYKITSRYNEFMLFENEDDKQLFIEEKLIQPSKAFSIKGCGVDKEYYQDLSEYKFENGIIRFTFIGRLLKDKGIEEFVTAAKYFKKRNTKIEFQVLGDFDQENPSSINQDSLLLWINKNIIDYKGFVDDIRPYIEKSSCIVLPSYREGMPRTILEAMSMRRPIITTNTAGCRETVEDGKNGYLVNISDANSLIDAMNEFLKLSKAEKRKMGDHGRHLVETTFCDKIIADELYSKIEAIL